MIVRILQAAFLATGLLLGQVEVETQLRMGVGEPSGNLVLVRTERYLYQDGALRSEAGDWQVLLRQNRVYIFNSKDRSIAEGSLAAVQEAIRKSTPALPAGAVKITALAAMPGAAEIVWQGKAVRGQACRSRIEMTGLATPVSLEHTLETYATEMTGELLEAETARASLDLGAQLQLVKPSFPDAARLTTALAPCLPQGRLLVRLHLTMVGQGLPMRTSLRHEVTRLRTGTRVDPTFFAPPPDTTGWARVDLATAMKGYNEVKAPQAELLSQAGLPAEPKATGLLKDVDELKRLIEGGEWERAQSLQNQISMSLYLRAEGAKLPPVRRLVELDARIAGGQFNAAQLEEAAMIALKLGDLERTARFARLLTEDRSRADFPHKGHTMLGLLAWRRGEKQQALRHLGAAAQTAGHIAFARMELAEKLADDGEHERVAEYLEACRRGSQQPQTLRMYDRAIEALRAKVRPYLTHSYQRYELPGDAR
ncbi:MAG: hypothetical protein IT162_05610 [Bryobacterales bacterium]|nr:hypothetical protein [Bryobacterales bacterium]